MARLVEVVKEEHCTEIRKETKIEQRREGGLKNDLKLEEGVSNNSGQLLRSRRTKWKQQVLKIYVVKENQLFCS